ncbi:MAG: glycosyltransferase family 39 protein [Candidatus Omnitrophica bacterium]|nr:glycosyltransferase family 39 protein [Candidatus Omnitrophota bacterium]
MKKIFLFLIIFLFFIFFTREIIVSIRKSITCDETVHITAGYYYVKKGDFFLNYEHPPFSKTLSGIFISWIDIFMPEEIYNGLRINEWELGKAFFYLNRDKVDKILFWSRFPMILLGILLGFFIYKWSKDLYGEFAGLFSLFIFTFCPNFLAHSCLVTTDVPFTLFFIMTLYFLFKFCETDNKKFLIFSGFSFGLSLSTKFTGIILMPFILFILIFIEIKDNFREKMKLYRNDFLIYLFLIPFLILLFSYGFFGFKNFIFGIKRIIFETTERGHMSYLNGKFSEKGWLYYFIFAFFYKTPIPLIILIFISIFLSLKIDKKERFLITPAIIYFIFSSLSKKQIGIRYILPFYALVYIFVGRLFIHHQKLKIKKEIKILILFFLITWFSFVSFKIHPHYIAYFNQIAGGPQNGWKYLIDSNVDWGQDLKELKKYLQKEGNPELMLNYFGSIFPETYGLIYEPFLYPYFIANIPEKNYHFNSPFPEKEYLAISVNHLCGLLIEFILNPEIFDFLKKKEPKAKVGYSIYVYDITEDVEAREKMANLLEIYGFKKQAERQRKIVEKLKKSYLK